MPDEPVIAIIDDDEAVRAAASSLVRSLGYRASAFASAEQFLESPRLDDAACLITDVHMPGMSGVDLQDHLKKCGRPLPMIFVTAYPEERTRRKVDAAGAIAYLAKPFDGGAIAECIGRALRR